MVEFRITGLHLVLEALERSLCGRRKTDISNGRSQTVQNNNKNTSMSIKSDNVTSMKIKMDQGKTGKLLDREELLMVEGGENNTTASHSLA